MWAWGRGGKYNIRCLVQAAAVKKRKKKATTCIYDGTFRWRECKPPGRRRGREGLEVDLFPAVWEMSRGSLPSAGGRSATIPYEATDSKDSLDGPANATPAT